LSNLCTNPQCRRDEPPRTVLDAAYLCVPCRERLTRWITQAPGLHYALGLRLALTGTDGEKVTGSKTPDRTINEAAADARQHLRQVLAQLAGVVVADRGFNPPATGEIHAVAQLLLPNADWVVHQEDAAHWYERIQQARDRAWSVAFPSGRRRFEVAPCDQHGCDGTLIINLTPAQDLLPSSVYCDTCDKTWMVGELLTGGLKVGQWPTANDLAGMWRMPIGTVYRWAHEDRWRRTEPGLRPVRYDPADARRSYEARRAGLTV
jgi:hypothetical protein